MFGSWLPKTRPHTVRRGQDVFLALFSFIFLCCTMLSFTSINLTYGKRLMKEDNLNGNLEIAKSAQHYGSLTWPYINHFFVSNKINFLGWSVRSITFYPSSWTTSRTLHLKFLTILAPCFCPFFLENRHELLSRKPLLVLDSKLREGISPQSHRLPRKSSIWKFLNTQECAGAAFFSRMESSAAEPKFDKNKFDRWNESHKKGAYDRK